MLFKTISSYRHYILAILITSVFPNLVSAKPVDFTCGIHFALDQGPDHIFEFHLNLEANSNVFWYRGHNYEVIYKFWADNLDVTNSTIKLTGGMQDAQFSEIEINRYTLGFFAKMIDGRPVVGACELGRKKAKI